MAGKESDKLHREIEELLDRLDNFVPEERFVEKIKTRRKQQRRQERALREAERGPSPLSAVTRRISQISLGQIMIAGLALLLVSWFFRGPLGDLALWMTIAGMVLTGAAFVMSIVMGAGSRSTIGGRRVERRWRGQMIDYAEPSAFERVRAWLRRRVRR
jgi:hypothetical protein